MAVEKVEAADELDRWTSKTKPGALFKSRAKRDVLS